MEREESKEVLDVGVGVFDLLKNDHRTVRKIMETFQEASLDEKEGLLNQLDTFFLQHSDLEERVFYPRLRDYPELGELVRQALSEHERLRDLLQQLEGEEALSERWMAACDSLEGTLNSHIEREEEQLMPRALELLPPDEMGRMKELVLAEQAKRPQPHRHRDAGPRFTV